MRICINDKVLEWTILLSFATNMVTQILYLGRMEVRDWYYTVVVFKKNIFNELSSILDLKHFNMNLNNNQHPCESFLMDF